ncbi:C40 family peptidase [bacterium]|nr:C40 family peptidase [bacterium]
MKIWKYAALSLAITFGAGAEPSKNFVKVEVADVRSLPKDGSEQVTQALLGDEVQLLESKGDWFKVFVRPQYRTDKGYPGWLRKDCVVKQAAPVSEAQVVVSVPEALLREKPDPKAKVLQRAGLGSQLALAAPYQEGWLSLWVPGLNQPVFAPTRQFAAAPTVPVSDGRDIVETAAQLKGTPYLWGGMSWKGIDCSGFTYTAYRVHGVTLPRDADQQFLVGTPVELSELKPGDLLFFGDSDKEISHVGMYMWDGKFIHASGSLGGVTVTKVEHPKYSAIFQGARRMLGAEKTLP